VAVTKTKTRETARKVTSGGKKRFVQSCTNPPVIEKKTRLPRREREVVKSLVHAPPPILKEETHSWPMTEEERGGDRAKRAGLTTCNGNITRIIKPTYRQS
jgi:hypothetical protein